MSDMSGGPGWWIASDGKWYPPHLHPSVRVDPPIPGDATSTTQDVSPTADAGASVPWSTDTPQEPTTPSWQTPPRYVGQAASSTSDVPGTSEVPGTSDVPGPGADPGAPYSQWSYGPWSDAATTAAGPKKRSRTPIAAALSVLVVLLLLAGAFVVFGGSKSASAEVIDAVNSTLGDKTAQIDMNETITAAGRVLTAKGTGGIDFTHEALEVNLNANVDGQQLPIQVNDVSGVIYEKIPGLDQLIPGKSWISIDLSALQNAANAQNPSAQGVGADPSVMLRMLAQQGNKVVALGPSTLDGVGVNGYAVTVNPSTVLQELKNADLPSWMRQAVVGLKTQSITMRVFVDDAGLLRSFELHMDETKGTSGPIIIDETLGFSDYGSAVSVTTPPAGQIETFEQFLQAEQAAQGAPAS
ncbi:MAG TPA: hypothetical protein VID75_07380 [Acidimicrobiales bacterium]|jgi:hypothetical protein